MMRIPLLLLIPLLFSSDLYGVERLTFAPEDFGTWEYPHGLVEVMPEGTVVKRFGKGFNALADVEGYSASLIGDHGQRHLWTPSNPDDIDLLADQDVETWWKPDAADPLNRWWVEIDLGRAVAANKLRLTFADTLDGRPFEFFSVYTSPGVQQYSSPEQIVFTRVGRPVNNNTSSVVEFDLKTQDPGSATGLHLVTQDSLDFVLFRFVRFEAAGKTLDAALAEIEVETVGFNLGLRVTTEGKLEEGKEVWGGYSWTSDKRDCVCGKATNPDGLIDGDIHGRYWTIEADAEDWATHGTWWGVDLGSVFRIDRLIWLPLIQGESPLIYGWDRQRQDKYYLVDFLLSDGTPSTRSDPDVEGSYDYELLSTIDNEPAPRSWAFDLQFPSEEVRRIFWRRRKGSTKWLRALQLFIYHSEGYPAQVQLESIDMDLGGAFSVRSVEWDADLPPQTRIEVETQTGNGYQTVTRYYLKNGREVTKADYEAAKSRQRGDIVDDRIRDATWSGWSLPHRFSGQAFLSPTPRQWMRVRVKLISDDPEVMPSLRSLSFVMNTPVIGSGLVGQILPREASLDSLQEFRYLIRPNQYDRNDTGFDRVLILIPPEADEADLVRVLVGGREVEASAQLRGDSLVVDLPPPAVRRDSVEVFFRTRLYESPTVFDAFVLNSSEEDNAQGVVPADLGLDQVYVPEVVSAVSLFQNLAYGQVVTPNGDGVNDLLELSFNVVKTKQEPRVRIYGLDGSLVAELADATPTLGRTLYTWDGRDMGGEVVPPGIYIAQLRLEADAGDETLQKLVHLVY